MTGPDEGLALLSRTPLFVGVAPPDLEPLVADLRLRRYAADSYIFREGDPGDHLHLVASGEVKISRTTQAGAEVIFAVLGPGDIFGELAVLQENAVRSADAQSLVTTECFVLHRKAVLTFLHDHPAVMWRVITVLSDRIRRKDEAFSDLAFNDIPARVARKLLELAERSGPVGFGVEVTLRISQQTLAGLVGASRENVNRALARLASLGVIKVERGRITLLRLDELRRPGA
ncbi:MAG: Crp/Fnr family transcriptional regulator [Candidatus Dormibacteraeota bacterium]|nr:Crp/Fnr family transcriptional regulator [Candidatus Dormibacteraeota bacterium]